MSCHSMCSTIKGRILYLGGFELPDKNAAAQRVLSNAKLLREMGYQVSFVGVSKDLENAPTIVDGFESSPIQYPISITQWFHHICRFISKQGILSKSPNYVVLYNFPAVASLRILRFCHSKGIKVIHDITEWESNSGWLPRDIIQKIDINLRMHYCMKKMDGIIAISRYLYDYYCKQVTTILVPPTVDLKNNKWNRSRVLRSSKPILLVYAGSPGGGVKDRLDLIVENVAKHPNMKLIVVGISKEQYFESFHKNQEPLDNIEFKGRQSHEAAVKEVCSADFQMLIRDSNRKNNAGFPTKLVESMACGTPVIATVFSNIEDYIKDGINCFLITPDNSFESVLDKLDSLSSEVIISMKQKCIDMTVFDYRYYQTEFSKIFI